MDRTSGFLRAGLAVIALVLLMGFAVGCTRVELPEDDRLIFGGGKAIGNEKDLDASESFDLPKGATGAEVTLEMGLGAMHVEGGASAGDLAEGEFEWSTSELRPSFTEDLNDNVAELHVQHGERGISWPSFSEDAKSSWDIKLTDDVPLDLDIDLGVGEASIVLTGLDISDLEVDMGVGDCEVDLVGDWESSFDADITAGVGSLTVIVPSDVGVRVSGRNDGIGSYSADGFIADGDSWVNAAWGESDVSIDIDLTRGVGDVRLVLDD